LKFAGGSFALMPRDKVAEIIDLAHRHAVYVSTGRGIENVLRYGAAAGEKNLAGAKTLGFDVVEPSTRFITVSAGRLLRLVRRVAKAGLKAKPELGIQFGAGGGATPVAELAAEGTRDAGWVIKRAEVCLEAGAHMIMIESEGIIENVETWRTDVVAQIIDALGTEKVHVRGGRPTGFRVVRQKLWCRGQSLRRSQPDRAARMPALRDLGDEEQLGPGGNLQRRLTA